MAWIESHQTLGGHPKTRKAAMALGVSAPAVVGHLHLLWHWALDYAEDGDLSSCDADDIAIAAQWDGDPQKFIDAMVGCGFGDSSGFLDRDDGSLRLHDWDSYAGRLIQSRRHDRAQKRKHRELYNDKALVTSVRERDGDHCRYCHDEVNWQDRRGPKGATYDYVDPHGPTTVDNVVVACRACNSGKNQRTPDDAGYPLRPPLSGYPQKPVGRGQEPTTTVPNSTQPNSTKGSSSTDVDTDDGFEHFWQVWPKRNGKKLAKDKAHRAWTRLTLPERRDAYRGATNYAAASESGMAGAKDAFRWLQGREWPDWQEPATSTAAGKTRHLGPVRPPEGDVDYQAGWNAGGAS